MFNKKNLQHIFIIFLALLGYNLNFQAKLLAQNSSAYNGVRNLTKKDCGPESEFKDRDIPCYTSSYNSNEDRCNSSEFKFDPFGTNDDLDWNYGNEACIGYMLGAGAALQIAFMGCRIACPTPPRPPSSAVRTADPKKGLDILTQGKRERVARKYAQQASSGPGTPLVSMMSGMPVDPAAIFELGIFAYRCNPTIGVGCCASVAICGTAIGVAVGVLGGIYETAKDHFFNVNICGEGWKRWKKDGNAGNNAQWEITDGYYASCLKKIFGPQSSATASITADAPNGYCTNSKKNKSHLRYCTFTKNKEACNISDILYKTDENNKRVSGEEEGEKKIKNIHYREYLFGGIEYEDNSSDGCSNPKDTDNSWQDYLGYKSDETRQKYYFRGPNQTPNFACKRFLQKGVKDLEGLKAFLCCNEKSQKTTCIERPVDKHKVCSMGGDCSVVFEKHDILTVKYKIFESDKNPNYICAKTYTVCPYDHNVAGGTDYQENYYYNPKIITNFCQYMNHCVKIPPISKYSYFDPDTFFFSESCQDLLGDSQFRNIPGVNKYSSSDFAPVYSRNFSAPIVQCFKETLENNFMQKTGRTVCNDPAEKPIKTANYPNGKCNSGYLYQKGAVQGQTFFQKVQNRFKIPIKIAFVLSVAILGFNILLATPESFINKKTVMTYLLKFGLVYFFVLGNAWQGFFLDSVMNLSTEFANITFRPRATIDTISGDDGCIFPKYNYTTLLEENPTVKITDNPSYPPGKNYLRIWDTIDCKLSRAIGYGPEVSVPNLAKMIFAGFLTGGLGITFFFAAFAYAFMLVSIIMRAIHITVMSLIGIILLIYVSPLTITCALFERTKGIFENWWKQMLGFILQPMILFAYLGLMLTVFDNLFIGNATFKKNTTDSLPEIDCSKHNYGNPDDTSIYCILNFTKFKKFNGLEVFDLAIPVLTSLNKEKINTLFRAAVIMFVFFHFLDKITLVAQKLVGGAELKADSTLDLKSKIEKATRGLQTRALNTTTRLATKQIPNAIKNRIQRAGRKDIASDSVKGPSQGGGDMVGGSGGESSSGGSGGDMVGR